MPASRIPDRELTPVPRHGALCAGAGAGGVGLPTTIGAPSLGELLPLALLLALLVAAGAWMFRRWGGAAEPTEDEELEGALEQGLVTDPGPGRKRRGFGRGRRPAAAPASSG